MPHAPKDPAARAAAERRASAPAAPASSARSLARQALALQQAAGNRAAGRALARWTKHPDDEKKGVMVPDSSAAAYAKVNPPQNA